MKATLSLLVLIATINLVRAGDFAGPPPFTNESPLTTGTDGTYQAIALNRDDEDNEDRVLTGVFSFVIRGGIQTADQSPAINGWVFFIDGQIVQGSVTAAISRGSVIGVLNAGTANLPTEESGTVSLPTAFVIPGNAASGEFRGTISYNSPIGDFGGTGELRGTPERTDKLIIIFDPSAGTNVVPPSVISANFPVAQVDINIPENAFETLKFTFQGTRVSTTPATVAAPAAPPSSG